MTQVTPNAFQVKNSWLWQQIEVEFPTAESLRGRARYQELLDAQKVVSLSLSDDVTDEQLDGVFLVDFHRLTVMFALLQAKRATDEVAQNELVEFFTQIIYSEPCDLYLGFADGQPIAAALLTKSDDEVLVSDVVMLPNSLYSSTQSYIQALLKKSQAVQPNSQLWLEQPSGNPLLG